jgi:L-malate glycosyltransferase
VTELFYPHVAGTEKRFLEIGSRLAKRGHEVHVFTIQFDKRLPKEEIVQGMFVHRYANSKNYLSTKSGRSLHGTLKYSFLTFLKLTGKRFDVCYSNEWPMLHSIFIKPVVSCLVQEWCEVWTKSNKILFLQLFLKRLGNFHVAVSEFTGQRLINFLNMDPEKVIVVPNGVTKSHFSSDSSKKVWGRIIYVGRLVPHKHVDLLLDAFNTVKAKVPEAELHIVGSGPLLSSLKAQASKTKDCFVNGFLSEASLLDLMESAWIFVLPSEREGSSIVAMEAMAAGTPIVTINFPNNAAKELSKLKCCLVTEPETESLSSGILKLLKDNQLWCQLKQNGSDYIRQNDWDELSIQLEDNFNKMVSSN